MESVDNVDKAKSAGPRDLEEKSAQGLGYQAKMKGRKVEGSHFKNVRSSLN